MNSKNSSNEPGVDDTGLISTSAKESNFELNDFDELIDKYDKAISDYEKTIEESLRIISSPEQNS